MFRLGHVECEGKKVFIRQGQGWSEGPTCSSLSWYNWLWSGYEKDLESPSSTRLEALVISHDSRVMTSSPSPCAWRHEFPGAAREAP